MANKEILNETDRAALIALYNSTNGDNWMDNTGWKTPRLYNGGLHTDGFSMPGTEGNWFGIEICKNRVVEINLQCNHLSGRIPAELGNLSQLEKLSLYDNRLSGGIPSELGNLRNLERLSLANNQLSGSIPAELGNLSNLKSLNLNDNQLSGSIPLEFGNLSQLEKLYLSDNDLDYSILDDLSQGQEAQEMEM